MIDILALEAAGSPQLMQALCLKVCLEERVRERQEQLVKIPTDIEKIKKVCTRTANMTNYSSAVEKIKDGPKKTDHERKLYLLNDGSTSDVYHIVLRAIAENPPDLNIRYINLMERVAKVCQGDQPSLSSVAAACAHLEEIVNDSENDIVVEWDSENDVLDIRDPYLLFYLRWAEKK